MLSTEHGVGVLPVSLYYLNGMELALTLERHQRHAVAGSSGFLNLQQPQGFYRPDMAEIVLAQHRVRSAQGGYLKYPLPELGRTQKSPRLLHTTMRLST